MSDLRIAEVSYDQVTSNFIEFLKAQDEFKDLDFEASAIRRIVSLLAYSQHYDAYYANASFKEGFLDSADLRASIVSHAKKYGYVPRSITSATSIVDVRLQNGSVVLNDTLELPKGTIFSGRTRDRSNAYPFVTTEAYSVFVDSVDATFNQVELVQGAYTSFDYIIDKYNRNQFLELPEANIDTRYLEVYVQDTSDSASFTRWTDGSNRLVGDDDPVYWIQEGISGRYQLYFGDGVVGRPLEHGRVVKVVYITTVGELANNVEEFTYSKSNSQFSEFLTSSFSSISVSALSPAQGGSQREEKEEIRRRAPRYNGNGRNALRTIDYEERILTEFPEISSVRVWDASFLDEPAGQIGKVFISAIPRNGTFFSRTRKNAILNEIQSTIAATNRCFEFIDPSFIYAKLNIKLELRTGSKVSPALIKERLRTALVNYSEEELESYKATMDLSDVTCIAAEIDSSVDNAIIEFSLEKRIAPSIGSTNGYLINFPQGIKEDSLSSLSLSIDNVEGQLSSEGSLIVFSNADGFRIEVGEINYSSGRVEIFPINVTKGSSKFNDIRITVAMTNKNIESYEENVLKIEENNVSINILSDIEQTRVKYL